MLDAKPDSSSLEVRLREVLPRRAKVSRSALLRLRKAVLEEIVQEAGLRPAGRLKADLVDALIAACEHAPPRRSPGLERPRRRSPEPAVPAPSAVAAAGPSEPVAPEPTADEPDPAAAEAPSPIRERSQHVPWSYGRDRVEALAVDPWRLFVYAELTDESLGRARARLGSDGVLVLRVFDVTGRLFDGSNAHGHFDREVTREEREWFLPVDRPGAEVLVGLGLVDGQGRFARIAKSRRVTFPAVARASSGDPVWMTVRSNTAGGPEPMSESPIPAAPAAVPAPPARKESSDVSSGAASAPGVVPTESSIQPTPPALPDDATMEAAAARSEGPSSGVSVVEEALAEDGGRLVRREWQVEIAAESTTGERRVYDVWEITRTYGARAWRELVTSGSDAPRPGASERLGASEHRFASEERFRGASELRRDLSSEKRFRGASERLGASERRFGGSSERASRDRGER